MTHELQHEMERAEAILTKGLRDINDKGDLNNQTLDLMEKTMDSIKNLCRAKEADKSYGHGQGMWTAEGSYGRMYYGRRDGDGDGRYYEGNGYNGYGNSGYSYGHNQDIVENLRRDLQNATSEQEREYIRNMLRKYEK